MTASGIERLGIQRLAELADEAAAALWDGSEPELNPLKFSRWKWPYRFTTLTDADAKFVAACDPTTIANLARKALACSCK